jgi:hypothetical protein
LKALLLTKVLEKGSQNAGGGLSRVEEDVVGLWRKVNGDDVVENL